MGRENLRDFLKVAVLRKSAGFSLTELLIVLALLGILMMVAIVVLNPKKQIARANDARRKSDLDKISKVLEDYVGDNPCYPESFYDGSLSSYLSVLPKDPKSGAEYLYEKIGCDKYTIYTNLETLESSSVYGHDGMTGNYVVTSPNYNLAPN